MEVYKHTPLEVSSSSNQNSAGRPPIRGGLEDTRLKAKDTKKNPRPRTAFPRTYPFKAKDRNARSQGQGPRKQLQVFYKKKVFKIFFQAISNSLVYPGFLIGGGLNHKSHEMTSLKFFQRGSFCETNVLQDGKSEIIAC